MIRLPKGEVLTPTEYAEKAGMSRCGVYKALQTGRLKSYKISRVWLIPANALIIDKRPHTGRYIGISNLIRGDEDGFIKKRGL